jgi:hypothetical protein
MAYDNWAAFGPNSLIREKRKKKKREMGWKSKDRIQEKKEKNKLLHDFDYNTC